jgi:hypothetical protein
MLAQKRTFSSTYSDKTADSSPIDADKKRPKMTHKAICTIEAIDGHHNDTIDQTFAKYGLKNTAKVKAAKCAWSKSINFAGPDSHLTQKFYSDCEIVSTEKRSLMVPENTPERTVQYSTLMITPEAPVKFALSQFPGGRFDDSLGVQKPNFLLKIAALMDIVAENPDLIVLDANSVIQGSNSNIDSYIRALIPGYITRQRKSQAETWMFWDKKDKHSGISPLDMLKENGYGILFFDGSSTSAFINGNAKGPDFIFYKESVFTPVSEVSSCEMYNGPNDQERLSDHKPIAVTFKHNQTGEEIRVVNANVECWFSTATPRGRNIDISTMDEFASTLVQL